MQRRRHAPGPARACRVPTVLLSRGCTAVGCSPVPLQRPTPTWPPTPRAPRAPSSPRAPRAPLPRRHPAGLLDREAERGHHPGAAGPEADHALLPGPQLLRGARGLAGCVLCWQEGEGWEERGPARAASGGQSTLRLVAPLIAHALDGGGGPSCSAPARQHVRPALPCSPPAPRSPGWAPTSLPPGGRRHRLHHPWQSSHAVC